MIDLHLAADDHDALLAALAEAGFAVASGDGLAPLDAGPGHAMIGPLPLWPRTFGAYETLGRDEGPGPVETGWHDDMTGVPRWAARLTLFGAEVPARAAAAQAALAEYLVTPAHPRLPDWAGRNEAGTG